MKRQGKRDRIGLVRPGGVDLDDLLVAEELVEAAAEMAARFDHDHARGGDVQAEHLKEHRVGALEAVVITTTVSR